MTSFILSSLSLFACSVFIGNGFSPVFGVMKQTSRSRMPTLALGLFFASKLGYDLFTGVLPWTASQYPVWLLCYFVARKSSLLSATVFFLLSNTACFFQMNGSIPAWKTYSADWSGYLACMGAGVPYYLRSLAATAAFEAFWLLGTRLELRPVLWLRASLARAAVAVAVVLAASSAIAGGAPKTVYRETFDHLGDYVACFNDGARISEAPASLKALTFDPGTNGVVRAARRGHFRIATPPASSDYAIHFAFQSRGPFSLVLLFGDEAKPRRATCTIAETGSFFGKGRPSAPPADGAPGFLGSWQWNRGAIVVTGGKAALHLWRNGVLAAEATCRLPPGPLVGWNLESASWVSIDYVSVVDGARAPYRVGDVADWLLHRDPAGDTDFDPPKGATTLTNGQTVAFAPGEGRDFCLAYRCGDENPGRPNAVDFLLEDGTKASVTFQTRDASCPAKLRRYSAASGQFEAVSTNVPVKGAFTAVTGPGFRVSDYAVPRLQYRYENREALEILAGLDKIPPAQERVVRLRLRPLEPGWRTNEVWIDSRYAGTMRLPSPIRSLSARFLGSPDMAVYSVGDLACAFADTRFLVLDVDGLARPYGTLPSITGLPHAQTVPFTITRPSRALNLAFCRENLGSFALECNGYLSRSAFDGMPSSMHFSVPVAQYVRAYALCAVDPKAPADFVPTVTARLTHYQDNGGRSQAACECTRRLPAKGEPLPEGVTAFGEAAGGVPVYQVAFDFDIGSIQDLTSLLPLDRLDLDFVGCMWEKDTFYLSRRRSPSYERQSSVQVYAATLERAPVAMVVTPNRPNSVYYPQERPGATVSLSPLDEGPYTFSVEVRSAAGDTVVATNFTASGAVEKAIEFNIRDYGHYDVAYTVADAAGKATVTHRGSFSLVPPDTRKAGYDSPYYVWNFRGAHGTPRRIEDYGDMLRRMGVRRTLLSDDLCETNPLVQPYKLTLGQFPYYRVRPKAGQTAEEAAEEMKATIREKMARFPHCRTAIIFHESGGGPFPQELLNGRTEVTPQIAAADTNRLEAALATARVWREIDPDVRLILGNSGFSLGLLGQLFRAGYPKEMIDAMGDESVGMTQPPERSVAYPAWMLRKLARAYGYDDAAPDAPWEWKSRVIRHLGEADFAAFKVRDALVCHAWKYTTIPLSGLTEMANSYYDTIWGDGCFTRWPLAYPHQCFTATATLTLLLDCAKFVRQIPTGSLTAYCLEFVKPDNSYVYALWTARAEMEAEIQAAEGVRRLTVTDMLGVASKLDVGTPLPIGPHPLYLSTDDPLLAVRATAEEDFAAASARRAASAPPATVVQPLDDPAAVKVERAADRRIETGLDDPPFLCFHRAGAFEVAATTNGCLRVTRTSTNACPELVEEYAFLRFANPKPAEGRPTTIGVWAKGNSSWGKLYFEFTDAEGERWLSAGTGGYGCSTYDWPETASLNFDGWQFVEFPITGDSPVKVFSPGETEWQWQRDGERGNGRIDFPITPTALGVGMYPHALNLVEMEETDRSILLKDLSTY